MPPESLPASRSVKGASAGEVEESLEGFLAFLTDDAAQIGVKVEVLVDGQVFVQTEPLRHVACNFVDLRQFRPSVETADADASLTGKQQAVEESQQRRFAGTIRTDKPSHATGFDPRGESIHSRGTGAGETFRQVLGENQRLCHGSLLAARQPEPVEVKSLLHSLPKRFRP